MLVPEQQPGDPGEHLNESKRSLSTNVVYITPTLTDTGVNSAQHIQAHTYKQSYTASVSIEATIECALHHLLVAFLSGSREPKAKGVDTMSKGAHTDTSRLSFPDKILHSTGWNGVSDRQHDAA